MLENKKEMVSIRPHDPFVLTAKKVGDYNLIESPQILDKQEQVRYRVLQASRIAFLSIYHRFFKGDEKVLEVGSGLGFLRRNWLDKFKGEWIELEFQKPFLEEAKRRYQGGVYVCGSADYLPFAPESLDVVCSLASYDELPDLEKAIQEASRILKKGGLFLSMFDVVPSNRARKNPNSDFYTRLYDVLSQKFDPSTVEQTYSVGVAKHKKGELHRESRTSKNRDAFIFCNIAGKFYVTDYKDGDFIPFLERELMHAPKETIDQFRRSLEPHHSQLTYGLRRKFHLGEEPLVLEIAAIQYTAARK